jgi:hypothetical protein
VSSWAIESAMKKYFDLMYEIFIKIMRDRPPAKWEMKGFHVNVMREQKRVKTNLQIDAQIPFNAYECIIDK